MSQRPRLQTDRLILRPFSPADAKDVQRLAGAREIASTTLRIPHPYEDGVAEAWIATHQEAFEKGKSLNLAIALKHDGTLIGAIGLDGLNRDHAPPEIGYWIGVPYWGKGYCTEAARAVLQYGFEVLALNSVIALHFTRNPASGRVMQKLGMTREGHHRQRFKKWGVFEDAESYGILRSEWQETRA